MHSPLSLCVVVPMYNEEVGAEDCVRAICGALDTLPCRSALIVVNDGSRDRTGEILARLSPEFDRLTVVTHAQNQGYGAGLKTGARQAAKMGFDYVLFMDSDLTNDPKYLSLFVEKMVAGYDVIKASRYIPGGRMEGVPVLRKTISLIGNAVARRLMGIPVRDCTNGFRAIRLSILQQMPLRESGFPIIMEEMYYSKFLAKTFCEIPYVLKSRERGTGKSKFRYRPRIFVKYLRYPVRMVGVRMKILPEG